MLDVLVLVVEDNHWIAIHLERMLERIGCRVLKAGCVKDAIAAADSIRPDVVLMDIWLPEGEAAGIVAAQYIHEFFGTPVIFTSAHDDPETRTKIREAGDFGFIAKPYVNVDFESVIRAEIARRVRTE